MAVEGVVTHGLVLEKATAAIIATAEGPKVLYQVSFTNSSPCSKPSNYPCMQFRVDHFVFCNQGG